MTEFTPVQFGKYILLDRIATGGMAELYRAKITGVKGFEKLIAIKKILPHLTSEESLITSFIEEAKLAAFLQHPNIVQIYDFGNMDSQYFLAMEFLLGRDLKYVTKKSEKMNKPLRLENALYIAVQVCKGLNYAHNLKDFHGRPLNIIHRDIGPQNIFITYDGQVKVIDFGIAKAANQNTRTQENLIKGKIAYMSPEQALGGQIDHRSDIFSIGILLYELITRKRMYVGDHYQIYVKVRKAEFEPPEIAGKGLPPELHHILNKALAKRIDQRYQSADEMASDLEKLISLLPFQPSAKTLSGYMNSLLRKEAVAEERAMRKAVLFDPNQLAKSAGDTNLQGEDTLAYKTGKLAEKSKRKRSLGAILMLLLILNCVFYTGVVVDSPGHIFERGKRIIQSRFFGQSDLKQPSMQNSVNGAQAEAIDLSQASKPHNNLVMHSIPDPPELEKAVNLVQAKRFEEAIVLFEDLLEKAPSLKKRGAEPYSRALQGQAALKLEADAPEEAKQLLLKSVEIAPEDSSGHYLLGRIYTKEKNYLRAVASYERAVQLKTDIPGVYFNLGYIYYSVLEDYSRAQELYKRTVQLSPPFLDEALFNLALAQKQLGKTEESIDNLEKAIRANPNNKSARELLERLTTGPDKKG